MKHQALTSILTEQKLISDCRYRVIESSSLVPVLFRVVFSHPYISFFHLLANGFSVMVSSGISDVMIPSVYSEKTRLKKLMIMIKGRFSDG